MTGYDEGAGKPCSWNFYKSAEQIPEQYYTRVGRKKPARGEGAY